MTAPALTPRSERVPFSRAVVVTPVDGSLPQMKVQGANLSKSGMFVKSAEALQPGTKVSLALEARGQAFPFAEAEVVWEREEAATDEVIPGFALRFVNFLHPRAPELVDALLEKAAKKKAALEQFAAPPEKFTELSLGDGEKKMIEESVQDEATEAPPATPRRTRTDPEFMKTGESFVIDLQKEIPPEVSFDDEEGAPRPSAFKSSWPKVMGALAFAPLFLVPIGVAIGTWRASRSPEPTAETRMVEIAQAAPKVEPVVVTIPEQQAAPAVEPQIVVAPPVVDPAPLVQPETPAVKALPKLQARTEPKPRAETPKKSAARLGLELTGVKSLSFSNEGGQLGVSLQLADGASIRRAFALKAPDRLVIDVAGAKAPKSAVHAFNRTSGMKSVRVGAQPDGVRLVVDLTSGAKDVRVAGAKVTAKLAP